MSKAKNILSSLKTLASRAPVLNGIFRAQAAPETFPLPRWTPQEIYGLVCVTSWFYGLEQELQASFKETLMRCAPDHHMFLSPDQTLKALEEAVYAACLNSQITRSPMNYDPQIARLMQREMAEKEAAMDVDCIEELEQQFLRIGFPEPAHPGQKYDIPLPDDGNW